MKIMGSGLTNQKLDKLYVIREKLAREGVKHKGRSVPFGITDTYLPIPGATIKKIVNAGQYIGEYLLAVNNLIINPELEELKNQLKELQLLDRPQANAYRNLPDATPSMFRLDLMLDLEGGFKTAEIELSFGGLGYKDSIRNAVFPQNPPQSIGVSFAKMLTFLSQKRGEVAARASLVTLNLPVLKPYLEDLALFRSSVHNYYPNYDVVLSDALRLDKEGNLTSKDNPEPIRFVHRFFDIYSAACGDIPNVDLLLRAYRNGTSRDLPSFKQFLEEKLVMALAWKSELREYFEKEIGKDKLNEVKSILPKTYLLSPATHVELHGRMIPVSNDVAAQHFEEELSTQFPNGQISKVELIQFARKTPLVADSARNTLITFLNSVPKTVSIKGIREIVLRTNSGMRLSTIPNKERCFVIKLSGFSEGAAEAKSVEFLDEMTGAKAEEVIIKALESGEVYVIQEKAKHRTFPLSGIIPMYKNYKDPLEIEPNALQAVTYAGYARVEPHYFLVGPNTWECADIFATVTPDKKTHGRTDAIMTYGKLPRLKE